MPMLMLAISGLGGTDHVERLPHHLEESIRDQLRALTQDRPVDEHDELVAAHPADGVGVAQGTGEPIRHRDQQAGRRSDGPGCR